MKAIAIWQMLKNDYAWNTHVIFWHTIRYDLQTQKVVLVQMHIRSQISNLKFKWPSWCYSSKLLCRRPSREFFCKAYVFLNLWRFYYFCYCIIYWPLNHAKPMNVFHINVYLKYFVLRPIASNMVPATLMESRGWPSAIEQQNPINNQFIKPSTLFYLFLLEF